MWETYQRVMVGAQRNTHKTQAHTSGVKRRNHFSAQVHVNSVQAYAEKCIVGTEDHAPIQTHKKVSRCLVINATILEMSITETHKFSFVPINSTCISIKPCCFKSFKGLPIAAQSVNHHPFFLACSGELEDSDAVSSAAHSAVMGEILDLQYKLVFVCCMLGRSGKARKAGKSSAHSERTNNRHQTVQIQNH